MADQDRIVYRKADGKWADEAVGAERAAALYDTQAEAIASARDRLQHGTGGELIIKGEDGQIRRKLTVGRADDPFPPRDKNR